MNGTPSGTNGEHADSGFDDYAERVLRNEARLVGLEDLVRETREADRKLVEQRSDSLAQELERRAESLLELVTARADAVLNLSIVERQADLREFRDAFASHSKLVDERWAADNKAMKLAVDGVADLFKEKMGALEERRIADTQSVRATLEQWHNSDRAARELQAEEYARRLDVLNGEGQRIAIVQANSVTRELFNADREGQRQADEVVRDKLVSLDRTLLGMTPLIVSDKSHVDLADRLEISIASAVALLDTKIGQSGKDIVDLKTRLDLSAGKVIGANALYVALIAAVGLIVSIIIAANALTGK